MWAGVMAPDNGQDWNDDGTITTRCISAEYQFWRRRSPLYDVTLDHPHHVIGTEGEILRQLMRYANTQEDALLRPGRIYFGGRTGVMALRYSILGELILELLDRVAYDFWVAPTLVDGLLRFKVNLLPHRGRDYGFTLRERINMERPGGQHHRRDGTLCNDILVTAEGADTAIKPMVELRQKNSIRKYGLWQGVDSVPGEEQFWAEIRAAEILNKSGLPQEKDKVIAIETPESPNTFSFVNLGDTVRIQKDSVVFCGTNKSYTRQARIVAREYASDSKKCILTMDGDNE
jgi:hypothetical protein